MNYLVILALTFASVSSRAAMTGVKECSRGGMAIGLPYYETTEFSPYSFEKFFPIFSGVGYAEEASRMFDRCNFIGQRGLYCRIYKGVSPIDKQVDELASIKAKLHDLAERDLNLQPPLSCSCPAGSTPYQYTVRRGIGLDTWADADDLSWMPDPQKTDFSGKPHWEFSSSYSKTPVPVIFDLMMGIKLKYLAKPDGPSVYSSALVDKQYPDSQTLTRWFPALVYVVTERQICVPN